MPTFSTKQYAWSDVNVMLLGRQVTGIQGLSYKVSQEKEYVYGRGNEPLSIQSGNKSVEGSITLLQSEVIALTKAVKASNPTHNLTDISFDIVVAYGDDTVTTDIVMGVEFTEYEKSLDQGDANMEIELSFMALYVQESV